MIYSGQSGDRRMSYSVIRDSIIVIRDVVNLTGYHRHWNFPTAFHIEPKAFTRNGEKYILKLFPIQKTDAELTVPGIIC